MSRGPIGAASGPTRLALAALLALASAGRILAQDAAQDAAQAAPSGGAGPSAQALPQDSRSLEPAARIDGESSWSRFGIVTVGSFPIMLLYTNISFDLGAFFSHGFDSSYAPWPFKSEYAEEPSQAEKGARLGVAVGASVAVGLVDYLIRSSKAKKARLHREAMLELSAEEGTSGQAGDERIPAPASVP